MLEPCSIESIQSLILTFIPFTHSLTPLDSIDSRTHIFIHATGHVGAGVRAGWQRAASGDLERGTGREFLRQALLVRGHQGLLHLPSLPRGHRLASQRHCRCCALTAQRPTRPAPAPALPASATTAAAGARKP